jgi:hypothetical protein
MNYIDLNYATYNTRNYYLSIIILILYITFISKLFVAIKFEILNKREVCDINFYYSKPCRNYIANNVLMDHRLVSTKRGFFDNANQKITPVLDIEGTFSSAGERSINKNIIKHEKELSSNKNIVQTQFQTISEALNYTISSIMDNFNSLLNVFNINNSDILKGFGKLNETVKSTPGAIKPILDIVGPTIASSTAPLQKLYQSLTTPGK